MKDHNRDKLHERTKEGILEGIISEVSPKNYQQFSDKGKRDTSRQRERCRQSHRDVKPHGACRVRADVVDVAKDGVHGDPCVCRVTQGRADGKAGVLWLSLPR